MNSSGLTPVVDVSITDAEVAVFELAHVARNLLDRLREVDTEVPAIFFESLKNKIEFYANTVR